MKRYLIASHKINNYTVPYIEILNLEKSTRYNDYYDEIGRLYLNTEGSSLFIDYEDAQDAYLKCVRSLLPSLHINR